MPAQLSITLLKEQMYSKTVADTDPDFDFGAYTAEPFYLVSEDIALVNQEFDDLYREFIQSLPELADDSWLDFAQYNIDQIEQHMVWTDSGYTIEFEVPDQFLAAMPKIVEFFNSTGSVATLTTA